MTQKEIQQKFIFSGKLPFFPGQSVFFFLLNRAKRFFPFKKETSWVFVIPLCFLKKSTEAEIFKQTFSKKNQAKLKHYYISYKVYGNLHIFSNVSVTVKWNQWEYTDIPMLFYCFGVFLCHLGKVLVENFDKKPTWRLQPSCRYWFSRQELESVLLGPWRYLSVPFQSHLHPSKLNNV